ncbi:MAG: hypothetical protein H7330_09950, partial [Hymenobacteraceae bacterium]|nr:hypothetical protein [Hymenobacteraceae bacterium]
MLEQALAQRNPGRRPIPKQPKQPNQPTKPVKPRPAALTITHPNACGINIGSASHYCAVPPDRDDEPVREFPSFTADLNALADW